MNINLANIDFVPGQGGGEAVIRSLDVTENGTYSAPSGVDGYNPVNVNVSGGGSLTPEEQKALDTLVDSSEGVLYTKEYRHNIAELNSNPSENSTYSFKESLCKLGDDIYAFDSQSLYKLNRDKFLFEKLFTQYNTNIQRPLWIDSQGRIYTGNFGQLDITNGTAIELPNMNFNNYSNPDYRHINIFYGKYGVYSLDDTVMKFDEETQQFIKWNITKPDDRGFPWSLKYYGFWFDNHYITASENNMYEIKEYEDHLEFLVVTEPYFPLTVNGDYVFNDYSRFCVVNEELYYFNNSEPSYHLVSGEWEKIPFGTFRYDNGDYTNPIYFSGIFESIDSYIVLYDQNIGENYYLVLNIGNTDIKTNWVSPNMVGIVDEVSKQEISGQKTFTSSVEFKSSIYTESIISRKNIYISANDINLNTNKNVSTDGNLLIKGNLAATIDNTFVNIDELPFGTFDKRVYVNSDGSPYSGNWFSVDNRIFRRNDDSTFYEFNGTGLDREHPITFSAFTVDSFSTNNIYTTENGTYFFGNNYIYKWDNTHTDWVMLSGVSSLGENIFSYWWDGTNLRHSNDMILVDNGDNTYSWVEDSSPIDTYYDGYYFMDNGNVYVWCNSDWRFRKYDSTHKTYTDIGPGNYFTQCKTYLGKTFFVDNDTTSKIFYFDITKASQDQSNQPLTLTGISLTSTDYFFGAYGNNLYYFKSYSELFKSYDLDIQKPAVPSQNGTYVLKATVLNGKVTYSWVVDEVAQALQITNQILE